MKVSSDLTLRFQCADLEDDHEEMRMSVQIG
jgi:hypothetical protein